MILLQSNKSLKLRDSLFWDIPPGQLDASASRKIIVERVFMRGNLDEFIQLIHFYSFTELSETVVKIGSLDPKTLHFAIQFFNLAETDFKCYKKKQ